MGSPATTGEGRQNMLCAYLSAALLAGLAGNAAFGLWWLDPAVGLLIAGLAVKEGIEAWQGEGCCAPRRGAGVRGRLLPVSTTAAILLAVVVLCLVVLLLVAGGDPRRWRRRRRRPRAG